jgi:hypothetical protein
MNMTYFRQTIIFQAFAMTLALVVLAGCDAFGSDDEDDPDAAGSVLVANQGNFGDANGSVTSYDPQTDEASEAVPARQLGSIIQGALADGGRYYAVANTAGRLNVYGSQTLEGLGQSRVLGSNPRYVAVANGETAYVTNQKFTAPSNVLLLDVADAGSITVEDSVEVGYTPEDIALTEERAYTPLGGFGDTTLVAALDRAGREVIENIQIDCYARFAFTDDEGEVLLPCNDAGGNGEVVVLDGESGNERARLSLPGSVTSLRGGTQAASYAPGSEELYVVLSEHRIARIDTDGTGSENSLGETLSIGGSDPIGAVGYDAAAGNLYVGRASAESPFTQRGSVTIRSRDGSQVGRFEAGNAPAHISFVQE